MNAKLLRFRWLLAASVCVLLGPASLASAQGSDPLPNCTVRELTHHGPQLQDPATGAWSLSVDVHFICDGIEVFADEVTFKDKILTANGNVLVIQDEINPAGEHISVMRLNADRMEMNRETRLGTFYHAYGTARIMEKPGTKTMFGTQEPDIMFHADKIEKLGPKTYRLTHGAFTTCLQPNPRWQMIGGSGTVELGDHATMTNVRFMVKDIPVLYVPYLYYPLTKDDRSTGLLIPVYSTSGIKGNGISNAYFLVLGRSQDATLYYDYFTKAGQGAAAEYRFASAPNYGGRAFFHTFYEKEQLDADGHVERTAHTSYNFDGSTSQALGHGFKLVANSNYFTDITAQQRYQQGIQAASNQRRTITAEVSGRIKLGPGAGHAPSMDLSGLYSRNEIFSSDQSSLQGYAPKVTMQLYDNLLKSETACRGLHHNFLCKVNYQLRGEGGYLQSRPFGPADAPGPETTVRRFDAQSTVSAPLSSREYFRVTTSAQWRLTEYLDSRDPVTGLVAPLPLTRSVFDLRAAVTGPTVERTFHTPDGRFAQAYKHIIEPRVQIDWLSPFDQANRIFIIDSIDQAPTGSTSVSYMLTNALLVKPHGPETTPSRPFLSVAIGQKYYSNAQAATVDPVNPISGAGTLSPVTVQVVVSPTGGVSGQFGVYKNALAWPKPGVPQPDTQFSGSANVHLNHDRLLLSGGWSKTNYYTAAQGFVDLPPVHFLNAATSVNAKDGRMGGTYGFNFDAVHRKFLQHHVVIYYHAQCCGIALDYQAYSTVSASIPTDHRMTVTFTLAGIGSFSPPLGAFGR